MAPEEQDRIPAVRLGSVVRSSFSIGGSGNRNSVVNHDRSGAAQDATYEELRTAIAELRADLARLTPRAEVEVLDAELVEAENELTASGTAGAGRLARVRDALTSAGGVVELLASGGAVLGAVTQLLGG
ncbi:hypothetical protein [Streptomyces sp. NPDC060031]|uniref:hypothetical protein n=1 Tax=Streptomyces sp. NPDC060031 TaxID=3347043 RepID=UPI0036A16F46